MALQPKTRKRIFYGFLGLFAFSLVGGFFANRWVKSKGYSNLWEFITTTSSNYAGSFKAQYETLSITIDEADFKKLEQQRERSLERGVMVNEEDSYVDALLEHNGTPIRAELRLKGHMLDHLQEKKWSFRVKTKKGDAFLGMKRFSLQHPGTRNYIYEWIFHTMMEHEDIMALRYMFLHVNVNGENWGVYALEEHFGQELVENNERLKGPIIRYNPELYWVYRLNELNKINITEEYAQMQSSYFEPYDTKNTLKDSSLRKLFVNAMERLEGFRRGDLTTSEVFDIEKLARFHAIIDLVGGHHSLDWSDVKYYYNSQTQLLEPVSYESFSVRKTNQLAGSYRFTGKKEYINDHHNALFNDTAFFAAYIRALDRIATKEWLDQFLTSVDPVLKSHLAILNAEFPFKKYDPNLYYNNAKSISAILKSPKGFYAHLEKIKDDSLEFSIGGIESLPSVIYALKIDSLRIPLAQPMVVPSKTPDDYVNYKKIKIGRPAGLAITEKTDFVFEYSLPGRTERKEEKSFTYSAYSYSKAEDAYLNQPANLSEFPFMVVEESSKTIHVVPGHHTLDRDMIIPSGYTVVILAQTSFNLKDKAKIISHSSIDANGEEGNPIVFSSEDGTGMGIILLETSGENHFNFVHFKKLSRPKKGDFSHDAVFNVYGSSVEMKNCLVEECKGAGLSFVRCNARLQNVYVYDCSSDGIRFFFGNAALNKITVKKCGDNGIVLNNAIVRAEELKISKTEDELLKIEDYSTLRSNTLDLSEGPLGINLSNSSVLNVEKLNLSQLKLGLKVHHKGQVFGPASGTIKSLKSTEVDQLDEVEEDCKLEILKQ
ncbi:MAG: CotH kinase family protein [Flavobacteriales bacterium]|nr:CotH kinase family protein [Flavobacteriales bacterium]